MIWQIKLFFAALITLGAAFLVLKYNESIADVEEMKALLATERAASAAQASEIRSLLAYNGILNATLVEKQNYDDAIRKQLGGVHRKLNLLMADDPVAQEWGATPIPDSVRSVLQDGAHGSRAGNVRAPAGSAAAPNPKPDAPAVGDQKQ